LYNAVLLSWLIEVFLLSKMAQAIDKIQILRKWFEKNQFEVTVRNGMPHPSILEEVSSF
jgi:hypothetical protein